MSDNIRLRVSKALSALAGESPLHISAHQLLKTLGYESSRTADVGSVDEFIESFDVDNKFTVRQRKLFNDWRTVKILFQITDDDIKSALEQISRSNPDQVDNRSKSISFLAVEIRSFLFLAVEMRLDTYTRTHLAETTRAVNRLFSMPVIVLFRHGSTLTLSVVHRRANRRSNEHDVLQRVTLIKDIDLEKPHRAHIEVLTELSLKNMTGVSSFEDLHNKWEQTLNTETLNKRFYREIFKWFERATKECQFPDDGAGDGSEQRQVIRLIVRLLFIWFLKEKCLVPKQLFEEPFARFHVKNCTSESSDYYRAVLQNLFFATLNTKIKERSFTTISDTEQDSLNKYHYRNLLHQPEKFIETLKQIPFVNGGLFECLDDSQSVHTRSRHIDAFTDNIDVQGRDLHVPYRLLLGEKEGLFALFRRYKFTIEESTPLDTEVALDPELLGRVFENLLAAYNPETRETARKTTGSYYTPRPVVDYIVREALTDALAAKVRPTVTAERHWRDQLSYLLDWQAGNADAGEFFDAKEAQSVVAGIAEIKTLDPAVGSGAFPMSILHTLTLALRRLDPDGILWSSFQKKLPITCAGQSVKIEDRQPNDDIRSSLTEYSGRHSQTDFDRKLHIIQNIIFGADIQPIACQIAKLRFFISLIIEQEQNLQAPNFGISPLPNLETRILAADSLLRLERSKQMELVQNNADTQKLEQRLTANRKQHFLAKSRSRKSRIQREDEKLRTQLARHLRQLGFSARTAECITRWNPYDQNGVADWFGPEYMFGVTDGFDIVIGNPPYIQLQKNRGYAGNRYRDERYQTYRKTGDIYQLFYERGCELLKPDTGILAYITSNSWLKAEYGKPLRRWFAEQHTPLQLIEMGKDVFENANVDTSVLIVKNGNRSSVICPAVDIEEVQNDRFPPPRGSWGTLEAKGDRPWITLSKIERDIMEKMEAVGTPLKDWDISIYYGIKTGFNDAFIIDQAKRKELMAADPRSTEILRPIIRGRDIARYRAKWANLWLIDTHNGWSDVPPIDIDQYPAVKSHLNRFIERLECRQDRGITPFNLRNCAYHDEFQRPKLIWMHMTP